METLFALEITLVKMTIFSVINGLPIFHYPIHREDNINSCNALVNQAETPSFSGLHRCAKNNYHTGYAS
jgi:hypothetical protein